MLLPPDTAAFFAVFFDFPLTLAEDLQFCGVSHPVRVLMPGGALKRTLTDRARLLTRVSSGQRSGAPIRVKMELIKPCAARRGSLTTRTVVMAESE